MKGIVMEDPSTRTAQEVLDDHLKLDEHFGAEEGWRRIVEEDIRRNVSEDIVILIYCGTFRGHEGVRELPKMLSEELPEHCAFEYTYRAVEGRMAFMEWAYEDRSCPPRPAELRGLRRVLMQALQGCLEAGRTGVDRREPLCAHDALPLSRSGARFSTGRCWWINWL
jgi:hypothetical protein